jgi:peptidoglycan-N-acetylglucosamine deacetylase
MTPGRIRAPHPPEGGDGSGRVRAADRTLESPRRVYLDDLPPMMSIKWSPNSHGFVNPRQLEELWRDQFDWVHREYDWAVFPVTLHPDVSGKPQVLLMLERLIEHMRSQDGVRFVTMGEIADAFTERTRD